MDERSRWFTVSTDVHVWQSQPMTGIPTEVDVPKKVSVVFKQTVNFSDVYG